MSDKFILGPDGKTPVPCDLMTWARFFQTNNDAKIVKQETVNDARVSTVFLGLDHRFGGDGPPILWETMIFGGKHDDYQERYSSYEDAVAGHAKAVELAEAK